MTPARFRWGLLLVQLGVLLILRNFGVFGDDMWVELALYFPIVLIAVGVEKIFTKSKLQIISYLTTVALFFGGIALAFVSSQGSDTGSFFSDYSYDLEHDPAVDELLAVLHLDGDDLTVRDAGEDLISAHFAEFTRKPDIDLDTEKSKSTVEMTSRSGSYIGGVVQITGEDPQEWRLRFSKSVPLVLECYGEEADIHLNLFTTPLTNLKIDADDTPIYVKLGRLVPEVKVSIAGDDSKLRLRLPGDVGIKVVGDFDDYRTYFEQVGLIEANGFFLNEGFDQFEEKIEVDLDPRLKSVSIDFF